MRLSAVTIVAVFLAAAAWPQLAAAQDGRDFVFTDEEGHLVLRYAGAHPDDLSADQFEEIANVELSTMVHDRLRADTAFEGEAVDSEWAAAMETRIAEHLRDTGPEFPTIRVECRSASCRLVLAHANTWSVEAHRALMSVAQRVIRRFIETDPTSFEPVFLIAAQFQEPERPYMKLFLRRTPRD